MKKDKKVIKAHQGMAHVPKQNIEQGINKSSEIDRLIGRGSQPSPAVLRPSPPRTRGPIAPRPQRPRIQRDSPLIEPAVVRQPIKRKRPPRISDGALDGGGRPQVGYPAVTPRKLTSREKRRQGNRFKSQADEMFRQFNKQRKQIKPRQPRIATEQPVRSDPFGGMCPSPDTLINLSGNKAKQAGELAVGDMVYTQHENTLKWGDYTVSHVSIISDSKRLKLVFNTTEIVCSLSHKMYVDNKGWTKAEDMQSDDVVSGHTLKDVMEWEAGDVVKITVKDAHSYIAAGLLSHNKSIAYPFRQPNQPRVAMPYVNPAALDSSPLAKPINRGPMPNARTQRRNKGGAVKKKYSEVKTLKQGGYVSRAKYGSVDNLNKKK